MTEMVGIPGDRIRSFIERVEHIDEEIKGLNEGKKEVLAEAKGEGFDVKVLKEILRLRKLDQDEREEHESLLDLYLRAMEGAGAPEAEADRAAEDFRPAALPGLPASAKVMEGIAEIGVGAFRPCGHLRGAPRAGSQVRSMTRKPANRPIRLVDRPLQNMRSLPSSGSSRFLRE